RPVFQERADMIRSSARHRVDFFSAEMLLATPRTNRNRARRHSPDPAKDCLLTAVSCSRLDGVLERDIIYKTGVLAVRVRAGREERTVARSVEGGRLLRS